jgi:hypothetical protein
LTNDERVKKAGKLSVRTQLYQTNNSEIRIL